MQKTNAMRMLDRAKVSYEVFEYDENLTSGDDVADALGEDRNHVFKTLVTVASTGEHFVFVIPVHENLDLKKAAKVAGVKSVEMLKQKELFSLTGYIHGGCSPVGMKKPFATFVHQTAEFLDKFFVSGGRVGTQVKLSPVDLKTMIGFKFADLTLDHEN